MRFEARSLRRPAVAVMAALPALLFLAAAPAPKRIKPMVPNAAAATIPTGGDSALVQDLQHGGYVIFFRHAMTNWNERDQADPTLSNRALQRNLSEAGQREAAAIGQALKVLEIPMEKVLTSPFWRCRDTAQFAFGDYDTTGLLYWKGPKFREARVKMLSTTPASGKNLVLVGHQDQIIPLVAGLKRDQLQEGDALIFRPLGHDKYKVVRQVSPFDWARLAGVAPPAPAEGGSMPAMPADTTGSRVIEKN
jgi:phosphohistidine phosphatase SixA